MIDVRVWIDIGARISVGVVISVRVKGRRGADVGGWTCIGSGVSITGRMRAVGEVQVSKGGGQTMNVVRVDWACFSGIRVGGLGFARYAHQLPLRLKALGGMTRNGETAFTQCQSLTKYVEVDIDGAGLREGFPFKIVTRLTNVRLCGRLPVFVSPVLEVGFV